MRWGPIAAALLVSTACGCGAVGAGKWLPVETRDGTVSIEATESARQTADRAASEPQWLTSLDTAFAEARRSGTPILACFNGDPTDPWGDAFCYKMQGEIFNTKEFKAWAAENVVLFERQYPLMKPQDEATKKTNAELAREYNIEEFPTIVFISPEGEQLGVMGYQRGGAQPWIENARKILDTNK